jgi:hypothetical protein
LFSVHITLEQDKDEEKNKSIMPINNDKKKQKEKKIIFYSNDDLQNIIEILFINEK